jgi:hypothetical protein
MTRRATSVGIALALLLTSFWGSALGASPNDGACGPGTIKGDLQAPPEGFVAIQSYHVTDDCRVIKGAVSVVATSEAPGAAAEGSGTFGAVGAQEPPDPGQVSAQGAGSGTGFRAYAVQRTWDCCGILLNEYWTEFSWTNCSSFCGTTIKGYSGQDGGKWHSLSFSCGPGWYPVSSDHGLGITAGGLGFTSITLRGYQGYAYKGGFDCGGTDYYNKYTNYITGKAAGTWTCSYSYSWRKALSFNYQAWCGSGVYGQK